MRWVYSNVAVKEHKRRGINTILAYHAVQWFVGEVKWWIYSFYATERYCCQQDTRGRRDVQVHHPLSFASCKISVSVFGVLL